MILRRSSVVAFDAVVAGTLVLLVACSSSGAHLSSTDRKIVKSVAADLLDDSRSGGLPLTKKIADCVATGWVHRIGSEKLKAYGLVNYDLEPVSGVLAKVVMTAADAENAVRAVEGCADPSALLARAIAQGEKQPALESCFAHALTRRAAHSILVKNITGRQEQAFQDAIRQVQRCYSQVRSTS
jgi:hypothetical protein